MIRLAVCGSLVARWLETRVIDIMIPDWDQIPQLLLLRSVDEYDDSAFNYRLLDKLLEEIDIWRSYEESCGDEYQRIGKIDEIRDVIVEAREKRLFVIFVGY